ncbi:MAG TPA: efflux RND transporter periplasmic adaptor subunit [Alphaproteobacteria bacterium]|nr:efflux RND transporter periplasmic adaptor subunit [Alphaproteobacteria bacterium]HOO50720.1 efflux RND transporter periplasmic adaptor subunit [Alphaproteobacteria bacterium]
MTFSDAAPSRRRSKKRIVLIGVAMLLFIVLIGFSGFVFFMKLKFADFQPPASAANVVVTPVSPVPFEEIIEAVGTAHSNESAVITATVTETVKSVGVTEGQFVEAGAVLVELSDEEEMATLNEATRSYMRYNQLVKNKLGSAAERDEALASMEVAKAQLNQRRIVAPFDGIVGIREVSIGDLVTPGTTIMTLDDVDPIKLDFSVPERFLSALQVGMTIKAQSEAYDADVFEGKIYTIDTRIDPDTRSVRVRALVENPQGLLRPGLLMKVRIVRKSFEALAIPEGAIQSSGNIKTVFVVNAENKIESKTVVTGLREPGYVEIKDGLSQGDKVVIEGQMKTGPGAPVNVVEERSVEASQQATLGFAIERKKDVITPLDVSSKTSNTPTLSTQDTSDETVEE